MLKEFPDGRQVTVLPGNDDPTRPPEVQPAFPPALHEACRVAVLMGLRSYRPKVQAVLI